MSRFYLTFVDTWSYERDPPGYIFGHMTKWLISDDVNKINTNNKIRTEQFIHDVGGAELETLIHETSYGLHELQESVINLQLPTPISSPINDILPVKGYVYGLFEHWYGDNHGNFYELYTLDNDFDRLLKYSLDKYPADNREYLHITDDYASYEHSFDNSGWGINSMIIDRIWVV